MMRYIELRCFIFVVAALGLWQTASAAEIYVEANSCIRNVPVVQSQTGWKRVVSPWSKSQVNNGDVIYTRTFTVTYAFNVLANPEPLNRMPTTGFNVSAWYTLDSGSLWSQDSNVLMSNDGIVGYRLKVQNIASSLVNAPLRNTALPVSDVWPPNTTQSFTVTWVQELIMLDKDNYKGGGVEFGRMPLAWGDANYVVANLAPSSRVCYSSATYPVLTPYNSGSAPNLEPFSVSTCQLNANSDTQVTLNTLANLAIQSTVPKDSAFKPGTRYKLLLDCEKDVDLKMTFSDPNGNSPGREYLMNTGLATSVGVQVVYLPSNGVEIPIVLSSNAAARNYRTAEGTVLVPNVADNIVSSGVTQDTLGFDFEARYYYLGGVLAPGTVNSAMTVNFFYD